MGVHSIYSQPGWVHKNIGSGNLMSVNFINNSTGFMFRSDKFLLKTTNGGLNWIETFLNSETGTVKNGMFYDNNVGIYFMQGTIWSGNIFTTTNGGSTWNQSLPPFQGNLLLNKVIMINQTTGYACGSMVDIDLPVDGVVYKTTNAGLNWNVNFFAGFECADVYFEDKNGACNCDGFFKSTNEGTNWTYISGLPSYKGMFDNPLDDTIFVSDTRGIVLRSTNSGLSFENLVTNNTKPVRKVFFIDNKYGFAVGDSGLVIRTTNAGNNWFFQATNTFKDLNDVWFLNKDSGFISGDSGLLLITNNGGVTSLTQNYQLIPETYNLFQNYPNPFNPNTTIRFDIVKNSRTKLSVYDITGKRISILIDQQLSPGSYTYSFNAENLPGGVYFYRIESANFVQTKKMLLIK